MWLLPSNMVLAQQAKDLALIPRIQTIQMLPARTLVQEIWSLKELVVKEWNFKKRGLVKDLRSWGLHFLNIWMHLMGDQVPGDWYAKDGRPLSSLSLLVSSLWVPSAHAALLSCTWSNDCAIIHHAALSRATQMAPEVLTLWGKGPSLGCFLIATENIVSEARSPETCLPAKMATFLAENLSELYQLHLKTQHGRTYLCLFIFNKRQTTLAKQESKSAMRLSLNPGPLIGPSLYLTWQCGLSGAQSRDSHNCTG